jgi:hypothetical protein
MAFRDDFNLIDFAAYAVAVGLILPAIQMFRSLHETAAIVVGSVVLLPIPVYLVRLRCELPDWCERCVPWHLRATWLLAILAVATAVAWRFLWQE